MILKVNGKEQEFEGTNLSAKEVLLQSDVQSIEMVTVQLNGTFISKDQLETTQVEENDEIDFLYFMGGGSK